MKAMSEQGERRLELVFWAHLYIYIYTLKVHGFIKPVLACPDERYTIIGGRTAKHEHAANTGKKPVCYLSEDSPKKSRGTSVRWMSAMGAPRMHDRQVMFLPCLYSNI